MKVIADRNIPFLRGRLEKAGIEAEYVDQFGFTPEKVKEADALLIRTRTRIDEHLLGGSRVGFVATATIGMDQIDLDYTRRAGIRVCNAPGCNAPGVAQYVWSSLLRLGLEPGKHRIGVVGKGNVGRIVTDWGRRLGFEVTVCDPPRKKACKEDEEYVPLRELLREVDAVTFHTPLTRTGEDATFHLAGAEELALLKDGAMVVNAARGGVVDNQALKKELAAGRLRAVIDTWEGEPNLDKELLELVDYGTFHIAGYSRQGKERATRMALEALGGHFGIPIDTSGLEGPYSEPEGLSAELITASFDPMETTQALRSEPEAFDRLRNEYELRDEVK